MGRKEKRGQKGAAVQYLTRNQALKRLQCRLQEFRRLCILKGVHPREPKRKPRGAHRTYYHAKDINFLLHEQLLDRFREIRSHRRKVRRAVGRKEYERADRLRAAPPGYKLDRLVRERYPTFVDAVRDLDDPLNIVHLFAVLPSSSLHRIPNAQAVAGKRLALEWQAWVVQAKALRKAFVSVKGFYYQAEVAGQSVTWLVSHERSQVLPADVDFRVLCTFLEFYETLLRFVLFRLYSQAGLNYPPTLAGEGEDGDGRAGLHSAMLEIAAAGSGAAAAEEPVAAGAAGREEEEEAGGDASAALQEKVRQLEAAGALGAAEDAGEAEGRASAAGAANGGATEGLLFSCLKFLLGREVPRESLQFVIRGFGGEVAFEAEEAGITHHVADRDSPREAREEWELVLPQWVYDSVNFAVLVPGSMYRPGAPPPPHLSPFALEDEAAGGDAYVPDFATAMRKLKEAQEDRVAGAGPGRETLGGADAAAAGGAAAAEADEEAAERARYEAELEAELQGRSGAEALEAGESAAAAEKQGRKKRRAGEDGADGEQEGEENDDQAHLMLSRKQRKLYQAVKRGQDSKRARTRALEDKKKSLQKKRRSEKE